MKNNNPKVENGHLSVWISLFLAIIFLLVDGFGNVGGLRKIISFVFEPASFQFNNAGKNVQEYFQTFVNLGNFRKEYNALKLKSYEQESEYANYVILKNENDILKKQIALGNKETKYVLANVLRDDNPNLLFIDQGSKAGIAQGDIVIVANTFVGIVTSTDFNGSSVRLSSDENSHLEVVVLKAGVESTSQTNILSSGVVSGSVDGIKVENIAMNSEVADGDIVYLNDPKAGGFWVLGYVVALSSNPASTYKTAFVSPRLDYDTLMQVFVKVE